MPPSLPSHAHAQALGDSVSHLNASTSSLHIPIASSNSSNASSTRPPSSMKDTKREGYSNSKSSSSSSSSSPSSSSIRHKGWIVVTSVLCLFSVLNFISEASSVQTKDWNRGVAFVSRVQEQEDYAQEHLDLTLIEEMGLMEKQPEKHEQGDGKTQPHSPVFVPLDKLVPPRIPKECPEGLLPAPIVVNPEADLGQGRKIPKIVHMTGKSPCLTEPFLDACHKWSFPGHSFYFHEDSAVDELLNRDWPMFPQLKNTMECLKNAGGAAKADLWRYLVLWEYGGIYTDMDNLPAEYFNETTITPDTDAFFLQERGGWISQYFFAVAPKHPIMFLAVHDVMREMHNLEDTGKFYVPAKTGPGATKRAFLFFMGVDTRSSDEDVKFYSKPPAGLYHGKVNGNRTVTVEGSRSTSNQWVARSAIGGGAKRQGFQKMNITNYQEVNKKESGKSCVMQLHDYYMQQDEMIQTLRHRRW